MGRQESHKGKNATASGTALVDLLQVLLWRLKLSRSAGNPKYLIRGPTPQEKVSLWTFSTSTAHISFALFSYNFEASNIQTSFIYIVTVRISCRKFGQQMTQSNNKIDHYITFFCNSFWYIYDDKLSLTSINAGPMAIGQANDQSNKQSHITQINPAAASNWARGDTPLLTMESVFFFKPHIINILLSSLGLGVIIWHRACYTHYEKGIIKSSNGCLNSQHTVTEKP